ncbi:TatD family hydrolase [Bacillus sp. SCS-153A]|uniref:TatD family hydrolase n=1 Tax=Rossellomorea sedimentorum TaxID=3115294 RepID=UPI0039057E18
MDKTVKGPIIDSHIHLDMYQPSEQKRILSDCRENNVLAMVSVSFHLKSCYENLRLSRMDGKIKPAYGYHPEQQVPSCEEVQDILSFIRQHKDTMTAIGEVGLPYYLRQEHPQLNLAPYEEILELSISEAAELDKPIILHAIYEDADSAISMLERASVRKAHFHWFKGSPKTMERMKDNGYYLSVTPDILYEEEIMSIADAYPLHRILVETDGPWRFEGPFTERMTQPGMIHEMVRKLAQIKGESVEDVYKVLLDNTKLLYEI